MSDFFLYFSAIGPKWLAIVGACALFALDPMIRAYWKWGGAQLDRLSPEWRKKIELVIFFIAIFFAGYFAWKEEYEAKLRAEQEVVRLTALQKPISPAPARDPDGIYQHGEMVGSVGSARVDSGNSSVIFEGVRSAGKLDANREIEFRDWVLSCTGLPQAPPSNWFSGSVSSISTEAQCTIIRRRQ